MFASPNATTEGQDTKSAAPLEVMKIRVPSPIGDLGIELHNEIVVQVVIAPRGHDKRKYLPLGKLAASDFLDELYGRFSEYFAGARPDPGLEFDLSASQLDAFSKRVLKETAKVPYGKTRTYRKIATASGRQHAYRQVLAILLANPIPIVIPCHRITTNKSGIGSYIGGKDRKRWLLAMEKEGLQA